MAELPNPYLETGANGEPTPTELGREYLDGAVTNTDGNVYSFSENIDPVIIAAAMARLSRYGGDLRTLLLKEFAGQDGQEQDLLHRVVTQFGDDSVQQLAPVPLVVENASNLLTKQLEWGRLAAYLEQSTRYIRFDEKVDGRYRYHTPNHLPGELLAEYETAMNAVFDNYSALVSHMLQFYADRDTTPEAERGAAWRIANRGRACDAARGLLPTATTSTVGIVGSAQAIDNMVMNLLSQDLPEANQAGREILAEARKRYGIFFERTDLPGRGEAISDHRRQTRRDMGRMARKLSGEVGEVGKFKAELIDYTPKDENEVIAHMLYPHSSLSLQEIQQQVAGWDEYERTAAIDFYVGDRQNRRHKPGRAFEIPHYTFDLVCDYGCFRDLQRHRMVDALEWQPLGHELGYIVPDDVQAAGMADLYHQTHQIARDLHSKLEAAGYTNEAQYSTLLSNLMRWKITMNAREAMHFIELRTQPAGHPGYRWLANLMYNELHQVHPSIAATMTFVNSEHDNPNKLSRLDQLYRAESKMRALGLGGDLIE